MKTTEYEHIICMMYCKRNGKGGDACSNCKLSPATQNNFIFNPDVDPLIALEVMSDGSGLLEKYVQQYHQDLKELFKGEGLRKKAQDRIRE